MMHIEMRLNGSRSPHCHLRHSSELCRNDEIRRSGEVAIPQLYAKLKSPIIEGTMEDGAVLTGPVHIGKGVVVHAQL